MPFIVPAVAYPEDFLAYLIVGIVVIGLLWSFFHRLWLLIQIDREPACPDEHPTAGSSDDSNACDDISEFQQQPERAEKKNRDPEPWEFPPEKPPWE